MQGSLEEIQSQRSGLKLSYLVHLLTEKTAIIFFYNEPTGKYIFLLFSYSQDFIILIIAKLVRQSNSI